MSATTLSYQWYLNNKSIKKATHSILTLDQVKSDDAGNYTVKISNASGTVTSVNATLVISTPTINYPISKFLMTPSGFQIQATNISNSCVVYASTNLMTWTAIATNNNIQNGIVTYTDTKTANHPARYYQIKNQ